MITEESSKSSSRSAAENEQKPAKPSVLEMKIVEKSIVYCEMKV
jgi:hypothetical protein